MPLLLLQSTNAIATNLTTSFGATGGTEPYVFSVLTGGAGGSIDASSGLYTSPVAYGQDTIKVVDAGSHTAIGTILVCTPLELVCDIIQTSMNLTNGQVHVWDQKFDLPKDSKLYVAVAAQNPRPFGNKTKYVATGSSFTAVQSVNMVTTLSVDIMSRGTAARDQKELVLLAFSSLYSQQQMERNSFFIAPISTSFVDISGVDGTAIPYRYQILVNMQYCVTQSTNMTSQPAYFDTFRAPSIATES